MKRRILPLNASGHQFIYDDPSNPDNQELFIVPLNDLEQFQISSQPQIIWNTIRLYSFFYNFSTSGGVDENLIYDDYLNDRYHFLFRGLKYYANISDFWYMNAMLVKNAPDPFNREINFSSLQSFANINLGVDSIFLSMNELLPGATTISEGLFESNEIGIRLVFFVDKLDLVERVVPGNRKVNNLQFHYTVKAYLIEPNITGGGIYGDFTTTSLLSQKSFFYEQTVPTYKRTNFVDPASLKTGWGHFLYPIVTNDADPIKYVQLSDVLKVLYNGMIFSQSTDNASLRVDSSDLSQWLNTDIELKNAAIDYEPSSVTRKQANAPAFAFTENNVFKDWLSDVYQACLLRGSFVDNFIFSYDNIYWEPLNDSFAGDVYSNSPATFMTRLTTYYQSTSGQSPIDEPGNFERNGGFVKSRRKYWLSNMIQTLAGKYGNKADISNVLTTTTPDKFLGSKFFPFYKFKQYNESNREKLDVVTIPFVGSETSQLLAYCDTSTKLKRVSSLPRNQYTKKFVVNPQALPSSLGSNERDRINAIGFVTYVNNDGSTETIALDLNAAIGKVQVFAYLTWIFLNPLTLGDPGEWTRRGRYRTGANTLSSKDYLSYVFNNWVSELKSGDLTLCDFLESGMYDTPEEAYIQYAGIVKNRNVNRTPSTTDPGWTEYFDCFAAVEVTKTTIEYCDPSPSPDGRPIVSRKVRQRVKQFKDGSEQNVGSPTYEYPTTNVVLKNQTGLVNGKQVLGDRYLSYNNCVEVSNAFYPYATQPTGPTGPTGPSTVVTGPTSPTGPTGPTIVTTGVNASFENFINPAQFNRNIISLVPSTTPIELNLDKCYYAFEFDSQNLGTAPSDYPVKISPGRRGQVLILEVNNLVYPYLGVTIKNGDSLTSNSANQKVRISTDVWGDGKYKSFLFMIFDGNDWVEFLRRDVF